MEDAIIGGIWRTEPVETQPQLTIVRWAVCELPGVAGRHLVGYVVENREGRVSSRIEAFDAARMRCRTNSGRVYRLEGPQGNDPDGRYVLGRWLALNGLTWDDVTWIDLEGTHG